MTKNASFDVSTDKIRPAVYAVGDEKKKVKGRYTKSQDVILF